MKVGWPSVSRASVNCIRVIQNKSRR